MTQTRGQSSVDQAEERFLAGYDVGQFERPSVAVDVVLLTAIDGRLRVLVIRRSEHPAKGKWSLPGGFVRLDESIDAAVRRVIADKADLNGMFVEQLYTFGAVNRDPRTRVISVAHYALVDAAKLVNVLQPNRDRWLAPVRVEWEGEEGGDAEVMSDVGEPEPLAFDHASILGMAVKRLRGKLNYAPIGFELLPERFTLRRLQSVHETILGHTVNKDAFRRRMLASGLLRSTGEREDGVGHRPAELFRFAIRSGE